MAETKTNPQNSEMRVQYHEQTVPNNYYIPTCVWENDEMGHTGHTGYTGYTRCTRCDDDFIETEVGTICPRCGVKKYSHDVVY